MRNLKKFMTEKSSRIPSLHTMAELATMLEVQNDTYRDARLNGLKADLSKMLADELELFKTPSTESEQRPALLPD